MSYLKVRGLSAGYGKAVVLRDLNLDADRGETLAMVGRNGAGKSTFLMSLFGFTSVHAGTVEVDGRRLDLSSGFKAAAAGLAIAPQGKLIFANMTVRENLLMGAASRRPGPWTLNRVYELFPMLGQRSGKPGVALSGGQQQMLAIGRALMTNPALLLLDEPTEGLAPVLIDEIVEALQAIKASGVGLIVVEQHLNLVRRLAERFVALQKGEIAAQGPVQDLDAPEVRRTIGL